MSFAIPYVGEVLMLRYILNNVSSDNARLHLYQNNVVPAPSDTLGTYSEVTTPGYVSASLTGTLWTVATLSGTSTATYPAQTFTFSTSVVAYGVYYTNNGSTQLLWAERFEPQPFSIPATGGQIQINPALRLGQCS